MELHSSPDRAVKPLFVVTVKFVLKQASFLEKFKFGNFIVRCTQIVMTGHNYMDNCLVILNLSINAEITFFVFLVFISYLAKISL